MKKIVICSALLLAVLLSAPAWSHHAAQGIVSDEIWQMVDDLLEAADSPHLNIDFDNVMESMGVHEGNDGRPALVTSIVVYEFELEDYLAALDAAILELNRFPSGALDSGRAATVWYEVIDLGEGSLEILLYEPVGVGNDTIGTTPPPKSGKSD
jgi:hypothetical protein